MSNALPDVESPGSAEPGIAEPGNSKPATTRAAAQVLLVVVLLSCSFTPALIGPVEAHRLRAAMTTVLFNDRTERIEVMHRFYLHDAEQVASEIAGQSANLLEDAEDRQRFGIYVHERFNLYTPEGNQLLLSLRGTELDGDFLWVYQAIRYPESPLSGIAVSHAALRDLWPDQVNTVNLERDGEVRTLIFRDSTSRLSLAF